MTRPTPNEGSMTLGTTSSTCTVFWCRFTDTTCDVMANVLPSWVDSWYVLREHRRRGGGDDRG